MSELPDTRLVRVFRTDDPALLPLATMALEGEGIQYVRHAGKDDSFEWQMSQTPTTRPVVVEIVVASDVAGRARDLLVDLEASAAGGASPFVAPADPPADRRPSRSRRRNRASVDWHDQRVAAAGADDPPGRREAAAVLRDARNGGNAAGCRRGCGARFDPARGRGVAPERRQRAVDREVVRIPRSRRASARRWLPAG